MRILLTSLSLVIALLFIGSFNQQFNQNSSNTVHLPVISLEGDTNKISAAFYEDGFDFKYENVPTLTLSKSSGILKINLDDNFDSSIQLSEDYYTYRTSYQGVCKKQTYDLTKDENGTVSLPISRRSPFRDEKAVYYLLNKQGTFVFKVIIPLDIEN